MQRHLLAVMFSGWVSTLLAQSITPPQVLQIFRETIKEGKGAAHRKIEHDYAGTFRRHKIPYYYLALGVESGPGEVWFVEALPSFAAMEEFDKLTDKAPLKGELELLDARDGEVRTSSRGMTAVLMKDSSYIPTNGDLTLAKTRYINVDTYRVRQGHDDGFQSGGKLFVDAMKKTNYPYPVFAYQVAAGAPTGTYLIISPMSSLKLLDEQDTWNGKFREAMGPTNFDRLMKNTGDVFQNMETTIFAVSPEMSYVSKETEDGDPDFWRPKAAVTAAPAKPKEKGQ